VIANILSLKATVITAEGQKGSAGANQTQAEQSAPGSQHFFMKLGQGEKGQAPTGRAMTIKVAAEYRPGSTC
jgi:hypothetical protein